MSLLHRAKLAYGAGADAVLETDDYLPSSQDPTTSKEFHGAKTTRLPRTYERQPQRRKGQHAPHPSLSFFFLPQEEQQRPNRPQDVLEGGSADEKVPSDFDPKALHEGTMVELKHTHDANVARELAMDNLTEDPFYYTKLRQMQAAMADRTQKVAARGRRETKKQMRAALEEFGESHGLDPDKAVIGAGGAMYLHGLRDEINDIDFFHPDLNDWVKERIGGFDLDAGPRGSIPMVAFESERKNGLRVQTPEAMLAFYEFLDRPKDQATIKLLRERYAGELPKTAGFRDALGLAPDDEESLTKEAISPEMVERALIGVKGQIKRLGVPVVKGPGFMTGTKQVTRHRVEPLMVTSYSPAMRGERAMRRVRPMLPPAEQIQAKAQSLGLTTPGSKLREMAATEQARGAREGVRALIPRSETGKRKELLNRLMLAHEKFEVQALRRRGAKGFAVSHVDPSVIKREQRLVRKLQEKHPGLGQELTDLRAWERELLKNTREIHQAGTAAPLPGQPTAWMKSKRYRRELEVRPTEGAERHSQREYERAMQYIERMKKK